MRRRHSSGSSQSVKAGARGYLKFTPDYSNRSSETDSHAKMSVAERHLHDIFARDLRQVEQSSRRESHQATTNTTASARDTTVLDAELQSLFLECLGTDALSP